ncbi:MAG: carbonic anhydrase [Myxococcota bacterium]
MKKLINGIVEFRRTARPEVRKTFAKLALGQTPDALFVGCSDSRVVPNLFASTDPGDLFVMRNVGNLIPPAGGPHGLSVGDLSEAAALEYSVLHLNVRNIIICGHSECGAMKALVASSVPEGMPNLEKWLEAGKPAVERLRQGRSPDPTLTEHNQLSQINVLVQMEHVLTYPAVREAVNAGRLGIFGWYFDIGHADVYAYEPDEEHFVLLDETEGQRLLARMRQ